VILGLQPEERHAADARLGGERARRRDGRRRLVEAVERPEKQPHLLAGGDHRRPAFRERLEVGRPRRARGERRLLRAELGDERGRRAARGGGARPGHPVAPGTEVTGKKRPCDFLVGEVRAGESSSHQKHQLYSLAPPSPVAPNLPCTIAASPVSLRGSSRSRSWPSPFRCPTVPLSRPALRRSRTPPRSPSASTRWAWPAACSTWRRTPTTRTRRCSPTWPTARRCGRPICPSPAATAART